MAEEPNVNAPSTEEEASEAAESKEQQLEEEQAEEDEPRAVSSSMVAEVGFDREAEEVKVTFNNGGEASYPCSPEAWSGLLAAPSVGKWMWENVL